MDGIVSVHFSTLYLLLVVPNVKLLIYYSRHTCKLLERHGFLPIVVTPHYLQREFKIFHKYLLNE